VLLGTGGKVINTKILVVEDNRDLTEMLIEQFSMHEEFDVSFVASATEALAAIENNNLGLILLDVGLHDQDGRELCKKIRANGVAAPIIIMTSADSDADHILGLDAGANDYIVKPFKFGVLLARMRAHLRQHEKTETACLNIGPYIFRPALKTLEREGEETRIRLTEKETNILKFLYRDIDNTVSRETLLHEVWGYNAGVTTHTLETHIYRLRQKIEENPSEAKILLTEEGGYRLRK
jgi:DNA-binding response OmpR family regulator